MREMERRIRFELSTEHTKPATEFRRGREPLRWALIGVSVGGCSRALANLVVTFGASPEVALHQRDLGTKAWGARFTSLFKWPTVAVSESEGLPTVYM